MQAGRQDGVVTARNNLLMNAAGIVTANSRPYVANDPGLTGDRIRLISLRISVAIDSYGGVKTATPTRSDHPSRSLSSPVLSC